MYQNKMMIKNENMLRQENIRELDKAADIILGTKDIIRTGFNALDNLSAWSGLGKGEVRLLGARPAVGKTIMALAIAEYNAIRLHVPVFYITIQNPPFATMTRLLQMMCGIKGFFSRVDYEASHQFDEIYSKVKEAPLYFRQHEYPAMKSIMDEMCLCADPPQLVIVDELNLFTMGHKEVGRIVKEMRKLAQATGTAVLILTNVANEVDERDCHMPLLADLPVSKKMVDSVLLMCREGYYTGPPSEDLEDDDEPVYDETQLDLYDCNLSRWVYATMDFSWEQRSFVR